MTDERNSMLFMRSFYEAVKDLPPKQFKEATDAICAYGLDGEVKKTSSIAHSVFVMAKPYIDKNNKYYRNGKKGGRPAEKKDEKPKKKNSFTTMEQANYDMDELEKRVFKNG